MKIRERERGLIKKQSKSQEKMGFEVKGSESLTFDFPFCLLRFASVAINNSLSYFIFFLFGCEHQKEEGDINADK